MLDIWLRHIFILTAVVGFGKKGKTKKDGLTSYYGASLICGSLAATEKYFTTIHLTKVLCLMRCSASSI